MRNNQNTQNRFANNGNFIWIYSKNFSSPFQKQCVMLITAGFNAMSLTVAAKLKHCYTNITLQWRHNGRDGVSNHQPHDCLLNYLFRRRPKKTSKLHVTGLCAGNSPLTGEFPAQMASNAENVSISWRHHTHTCISESCHDWLDSAWWPNQTTVRSMCIICCVEDSRWSYEVDLTWKLYLYMTLSRKPEVGFPGTRSSGTLAAIPGTRQFIPWLVPITATTWGQLDPTTVAYLHLNLRSRLKGRALVWAIHSIKAHFKMLNGRLYQQPFQRDY